MGFPSKSTALSEVLREIANDESRARVAVSDVLTALHDRALAAFLFIFAFPNILPTPPGTSAVLGVPLVFLTAQLTLGLRPWLPAFFMQRSMAHADFRVLVERIEPWLAKAEKLLRPRAGVLLSPPVECVAGFICFLLAVVLTLPIPLGNVLPALAICLVALGILQRDGLWVLAGLATALVAGTVVFGVVFAMIKATLFLIQEVL